jgi:hypothetical protein
VSFLNSGGFPTATRGRSRMQRGFGSDSLRHEVDWASLQLEEKRFSKVLTTYSFAWFSFRGSQDRIASGELVWSRPLQIH